MLQWIKQKLSSHKKTAAIKKGVVAALFCLALLSSPIMARAQSIADPNSELNQGVKIIQQPLGLGNVDIRILVARIIRIALGLVGIVLLVLVLYGGFLWMTAGGNEEQIGQAKKVMVNAAIGLAIILAAFSIVSFILALLGVPSGLQDGGGVAAPNTNNFQGSGALGGIIKDHYPARNQKDVPRNTKIIITFRKPVLLNSNWIVENSNDQIFGNCKPVDAQFSWETYCDQLKIDKNYFNITRADTGEQIRGASILASYENSKVYTIVIRPFEPLGNNTDKISYLVHIGSKLQLDDPANNNPPAFSVGGGNNYYEWQFTCSTELDTAPPVVLSVFPDPKEYGYKNSVIQVDFSEAIDPIGLQGDFAPTNDNNNSFAIPGNNIFLKSSFSAMPAGTFRLVNGYRTLEFTPSIECGSNACGGKIYCLPVCDAPGAKCPADPVKQDIYEMIIKAGRTISIKSFEAQPFSGVMDVSGNALDGNNNGAVEVATTTAPIFPKWKEPDNSFWQFILHDQIDASSARIQKISPGLDAQFITATDPWEIFFSKRMRIEPLYDITIDEKPSPAERGDNIPLCKVPNARFNINRSTEVTFSHCPFLDGIRQYYFPIVSSSVEDVNFNCFYPGIGPGDNRVDGQKVGGNARWTSISGINPSPVCEADGKNCCGVTTTPVGRAFCCNGLSNVSGATTTAGCLNNIKSDSP